MLSISPVNITDAAAYQAYVTNLVGCATSSAASLTILGPPLISTQPANRTVPAGTNTTFSVSASGLAALSYQWRFQQAELPYRTNASLSLTNVQTANAGLYDVVLTNTYGALTSAVATLTRRSRPSPIITTQSASQGCVGRAESVSFSWGPRAPSPLACQWQLQWSGPLRRHGLSLALSQYQCQVRRHLPGAVSHEVERLPSARTSRSSFSPVAALGMTNGASNPQASCGGSRDGYQRHCPGGRREH